MMEANDDWRSALELAYQAMLARRTWEAIAHASKALELAPNEGKCYDIFASALVELSPSAAEEPYRTAVRLLPDSWSVKCRLARCLKLQGKFNEARDLYLSTPIVAMAEKSCAWALTEYADMMEQAGDDVEALYLWEVVQYVDGWQHDAIVRIAAIKQRQGRTNAARRLLDKANYLTPEGYLAAGRVYDAMGDHTKAWHHFKKGKLHARGRGEKYDSEVVRDMFDKLRAFPWESIKPAPYSNGKPQPYFITGFMRSGTTLAEQIVSTLPSVHAGGELQVLPHTLTCAASLLGKEPTDNVLSALEGSDLRVLRDFYIDETIHTVAPPDGTRFVTDKMPLNEIYAPLMSALFPKSPIIRMLRHPLDVIVSNMSHSASHGQKCSTKLETLALHYWRVHSLLEFYEQELGVSVHNIPYEDLVELPQAIQPYLARLAGEMIDGIIDHTQNTKVALTPSHEQVKLPLYKASIGRWKHYRNHLQPAVEILKPILDEMQYEY